jgi:hypothetical protein
MSNLLCSGCGHHSDWHDVGNGICALPCSCTSFVACDPAPPYIGIEFDDTGSDVSEELKERDICSFWGVVGEEPYEGDADMRSIDPPPTFEALGQRTVTLTEDEVWLLREAIEALRDDSTRNEHMIEDLGEGQAELHDTAENTLSALYTSVSKKLS